MWYTILHLLYSILHMWYTIPHLWYINTEQYTTFVVQYTTYVVYISKKIEANFVISQQKYDFCLPQKAKNLCFYLKNLKFLRNETDLANFIHFFYVHDNGNYIGDSQANDKDNKMSHTFECYEPFGSLKSTFFNGFIAIILTHIYVRATCIVHPYVLTLVTIFFDFFCSKIFLRSLV